MRGMGIDVCKAYLDVCLDGDKKHSRVGNSEAGVQALLALIAGLGDVRVLLEATGGYEKLVLDRLSDHGIAVMRVNPQRARAFARGMSLLVKTDRVDAMVLAEMALALGNRFRSYERKASWQEELGHYVDRHGQVQALLLKTKQQTRHFQEKALRRGVQRTIRVLEKELNSLAKAILSLQAPHTSPAFEQTKGIGPKLTAALLSMLPELGRISNKAIASLVGVAPFNHDSGSRIGYRRTAGGRAHLRQLLYMASLSAIRSDADMRAFYDRLRATGKPGKVALVAVMRKMLVRLNARRRDELKTTLGSASTLQPA